MITPDTMPRFPLCATFGFTSEAMYLVIPTRRDGGFERLDRRWNHPLHRYTGVPVGEKRDADIQRLLRFWHALGGNATYFRFKDWADYKSCMVHETPGIANAAPVAPVGAGSPATSWRLYKRYADPDYPTYFQDRPITRPLGATVVIANELGAPQSDFTLNEATGVFTIGGSFDGEPTAWWGEFDVPCRFDGELPVQLIDYKLASVTVSICEKRERLT